MKKRKLLSIMLILSLFIGMVGIVNAEPSYAASKKIHVKKKTVTLQVGQKYQQKLIAKNGKTIKAKKVKWKSKKLSVAKINKKGKITAVRPGTAKMTAKYKGKTYKFTVKVTAKTVPAPTPAPATPTESADKTDPPVTPPINKLIDYLKENGNIEVTNTSSSGTRITNIKLSTDGKNILFSNGILTQSGNNSSIGQEAMAIDIDFDNETDKAYFYYRWDFYPNGDTSITNYSYRMDAYVDGKSYVPGDAIDWTIIQESSAMSAEDLGLKAGANSDFKKAIGYWNSALKQNLGVTLADFGMINCK